MDVLTALEIADQLGGLGKQATGYDEIVLPFDHWKRLVEATPGEAVGEYAGLKIVANPIVPEGYGIMKLDGKVVGVLDFTNKTSMALTQDR